MKSRGIRTAIVVCLAVIGGCRSKDESRPKAPRPVSVFTLVESDPGHFQRVAGTVASWKTDQLGFEVDGRVQFVVEPETDVTGKIFDENGSPLTGGTRLARLDSTRYELGVESAKAQVAVAEKQREAAVIEHDRVIPAQEKAATADRDLANIEVERNKKLLAENAAPERALDLATARLREAEAVLLQLAATKEAKASEIASIEARIRELLESQKQAERDLADCELFSSFPAQVADVHVVPGSFVHKGQAVITVQMMDPIKVEFEVAANTARRLNHRDQVSIYVPQPDGEAIQRLAFIYMIDPVADPQTRTYTVTLMIRNETLTVPRLDELNVDASSFAVCGLVGKVFNNLAIGEGLFINKDMLQEDAEGFFFWKILNRRVGTLTSTEDRLLDVQKVRAVPGNIRFSALGLATLRDITVPDDADFDPDKDLIAGKVIPPEGQETWEGDKVLYDMRRWLVRPGDMVGIDQSGLELPQGIYVPQNAIQEKSGAKYVFAVSESTDGDTARRVEVSVHESAGTLRRIESVGEEPLTTGTKLVVDGAAFVVDGENINVSSEVEPSR